MLSVCWCGRLLGVCGYERVLSVFYRVLCVMVQESLCWCGKVWSVCWCERVLSVYWFERVLSVG